MTFPRETHGTGWMATSLLALLLCGCTSMDMAEMDKTFHNTPERQAANWEAMARRQQIDDHYDGMTPYNYYLSKGFSKDKAQKLADADQAWGVGWQPSNF